MKTIAILNLKGGTAKTVTAATMARCLSLDLRHPGAAVREVRPGQLHARGNEIQRGRNRRHEVRPVPGALWRVNPRIRIAGILGTQYQRTAYEREVHRLLLLESGLPVFQTLIRMSPPVPKSFDAHERLDQPKPDVHDIPGQLLLQVQNLTGHSPDG